MALYLRRLPLHPHVVESFADDFDRFLSYFAQPHLETHGKLFHILHIVAHDTRGGGVRGHDVTTSDDRPGAEALLHVYGGATLPFGRAVAFQANGEIDNGKIRLDAFYDIQVYLGNCLRAAVIEGAAIPPRIGDQLRVAGQRRDADEVLQG